MQDLSDRQQEHRWLGLMWWNLSWWLWFALEEHQDQMPELAGNPQQMGYVRAKQTLQSWPIYESTPRYMYSLFISKWHKCAEIKQRTMLTWVKRKMLSMKSNTSWPSASRKYSATVKPVSPTRARAPGGSFICPYTSAHLLSDCSDEKHNLLPKITQIPFAGKKKKGEGESKLFVNLLLA